MKTTVDLTREAGGFDDTPEFLERLIALVRADEREACAKVCDGLDADASPSDCADYIRVRGETK